MFLKPIGEMGEVDALRAIVSQLAGIAGVPPIPVTFQSGSGTKHQLVADANTVSGNTRDGVSSVILVASSDFTGTVLGRTLASSASIPFSAPPDDALASFPYTVSAGTLTAFYVL